MPPDRAVTVGFPSPAGWPLRRIGRELGHGHPGERAGNAGWAAFLLGFSGIAD
jgi:hypothetical protein